MSPIGQGQSNDPVSKELQMQIADAQKQMQELAKNKDMSAEDKMKKRQELQQKINELNMQLRQHQIEQRKEKQQEKTSSDDIFDPNGQSKQSQAKEAERGVGLSLSSMEAMISADVSVKQADTQGSVASKMNGRAGVLKVEIQLDSARNGDVSAKQAQLADVKKKAQAAETAQLDTLAKANKTMKEAAESENSSTGMAKAKEDADGNNAENVNNTAGSQNVGENFQTGNSSIAKEDNAGGKYDMAGGNADEDAASGLQAAIHYTPVDVRL